MGITSPSKWRVTSVARVETSKRLPKPEPQHRRLALRDPWGGGPLTLCWLTVELTI